ncbi:MAG TPA: cupin domain-containing protein [Vicinamibacterales bacterium]|nr:cupin domain-containing protein [Vicinamibacterales bacterium]
MNVRRVVTGHDTRGKAVFVNDELVKPIGVALLPGVEFHRLWGGDEPPRFPDAGTMPGSGTYFPPLGGFRFGLFTLPPTAVTNNVGEAVDAGAALKELEEKLPGLAQYMEPDAPGMHTTPTIDFEVVLSGEVILELDNGATTILRAGDTVVQNGTRHRWRNEGATSATLAYFICGARHARF